MAYIQRNSPLKDAKFLSPLQPPATNPKELIKMTPKERTEARRGLQKNVEAGISLTSWGGAGYAIARGLLQGGRALAGLGLVGLRSILGREAAKQSAKVVSKKALGTLAESGTANIIPPGS
tara:strand:+ start:419 stop:781 length:363 start_codon:yes stop_codon:yes gene_type:complete